MIKVVKFGRGELVDVLNHAHFAEPVATPSASKSGRWFSFSFPTQ